MNVRAATEQDAAGIVALHKASNPFGDWYRNPLQRLGRVPYEDLTPFERYLHGGFAMDLSLFRRHFYECAQRGFPVLAADDRGRIVGACQVWLDEEPPPFGRYGEVAFLEAGTPPNLSVGRELLHRAAERVKRLRYEALDLSPRHSGGDAAREVRADLLWETRAFTADLAKVPRPEDEFTTHFLAADYGDLRGLLLLDHREPARWRFETLTGLWPAAQVAGLRDAMKLVAVTVRPERGAAFAVVAARREWIDPPLAELDVWMNPANLAKPKEVERTFAIAAEISRKLGAKRVETYAPPTTAKSLTKLGFTGGDETDSWLRWTF